MKSQELAQGLAILGILILAVLSITPFGFNSRFRTIAREKACYANMRVLLGALEMYNMDHSVFMETMNSGNAARLHTEAYLKTPIGDCPGDLAPRFDNPFIQARVAALAGNFGRLDFAYFKTPGGFYGGSGLASEGRIVCSMHGTVE